MWWIIVLVWIAMGVYGLYDDWVNERFGDIKVGDVVIYTLFGPVIFAEVLRQHLPKVFKKMGNFTVVKGKSK